ncbi:MAG: cytochrome c maturation protein CcmE [Terriglobus sp.]
MPQSSRSSIKVIVATVVIVGAVLYLAISGARDSKATSYYCTIGELQTMGQKAYKRNLRVAGNVKPGSIQRMGTHAQFVLLEQGKELPVNYQGAEPPPDAFKDDSQALAMGHLGRDGVFQATELQAKCASKYAPAPNGAKPDVVPTSMKPAPTAVLLPAK